MSSRLLFCAFSISALGLAGCFGNVGDVCQVPTDCHAGLACCTVVAPSTPDDPVHSWERRGTCMASCIGGTGDAGPRDSGVPTDLGPRDSGTDGGTDSGDVDSGPDAGSDGGFDAGPDLGTDSGVVDAGTDADVDSGTADADVDLGP